MTQFAVYKNLGRNPDVPFVVSVQSDLLSAASGRLVMALTTRGGKAPPDHPLTPHMTVQGQALYANPFNMATVPALVLKTPVDVLADADQDKVIRALDELVSRA